MAFCPSCGKELTAEEASAKFCAYCGKPLATEAEPTNTTETVAQETPVVETPTYEAPKAANGINIDVDEIKDTLNDMKNKALPLIDQLFEKLKTVPVLNSILEKIDKKLYPALLAAPVALLVLIIVLVVAISSSGSYMSPVKDYIKLVNKKSTDYIKVSTALAPDFRVDKLEAMMKTVAKADGFEDMLDSRNESLEDVYDELDDEFKKWKIGFKVSEKEKLDKDDLEDYEDAFNDAYDENYERTLDQMKDALDDDDEIEDMADSLDISEKEAKKFVKAAIKYFETFEDVKVTAGYEIKGKFTIKGDKDDWESDSVRIIVLKINGDWTYAGLKSDSGIVFDDDDEEIALFSSFFSRLRRSYTGDISSVIGL